MIQKMTSCCPLGKLLPMQISLESANGLPACPAVLMSVRLGFFSDVNKYSKYYGCIGSEKHGSKSVTNWSLYNCKGYSKQFSLDVMPPPGLGLS